MDKSVDIKLSSHGFIEEFTESNNVNAGAKKCLALKNIGEQSKTPTRNNPKLKTTESTKAMQRPTCHIVPPRETST